METRREGSGGDSGAASSPGTATTAGTATPQRRPREADVAVSPRVDAPGDAAAPLHLPPDLWGGVSMLVPRQIDNRRHSNVGLLD